MQNVLADLAVETEAATALAMRLAAAVDARGDPHEAALRRIALPLAKFWVCKRTPGVRRRGAGVPRRQRVRRGVRAAAALPRGAAELGLGGLGQRQRARRAARARPASPRCSTPGSPRSGTPAAATPGSTGPSTTPWRCSATGAAWRSAPAGWPAGWPPACRARCWSGFAPAEVADAFCGSRLGTSYDGTFGTLAGADLRAIVDRATPTR